MIDGHLAATDEAARVHHRASRLRQSGHARPGDAARTLDATALFVDFRPGTDMADDVAAEPRVGMLRGYAEGAISIIKANSGRVRSLDGDGLLTLFVGDAQANDAVKAAMQVNWFVQKLLAPRLSSHYAMDTAVPGGLGNPSVGIGLDSGQISVLRSANADTNETTVSGRCSDTAANLAKRLEHPRNIGITREAYAKLHASRKYSDGMPMWSNETVDAFDGMARAYRTTSSWWSVT
jgi:class 3 adenylate cyclase